MRVGTVSSVNTENRTARVNFVDKNNLVSGPLKILRNPPFVTVKETLVIEGEHGHEVTVSPWIPSVGDLVLCIYLPNGDDGFVVGGI
ncbi:hypothetical protein KQI42_09710 [Tissierella sp. MSJ-40]|uniref:Uncharacterized protein n=1 Tax=Tissierella simiarum TaxID=2841534 RepID=A0ABS6E5T6_9FIRM|nr:hypothetical protein [Tissierella simiarum]MBU5438285.1 hypothetical protein [Tissierella simiarum]